MLITLFNQHFDLLVNYEYIDNNNLKLFKI